MATCIGTSSSLRAFIDSVRRIDRHVGVSDLQSLNAVIAERRLQLEQKRAVVAEQVRREAEALLAKAAENVRLVEHVQPRRLEEAKALSVQSVEQAAELRRRKVGFLMRMLNHLRAVLRVRGGRSRVHRVEGETAALIGEAGRARAKGQVLLADVGGEVERRLGSEVDVLRRLEEVSISPEARGSVGELAVESDLGALSDEFWVFHDLHLRAATFMRLGGKPVQSAQVDHLVVGPTGVFLIETKSWSRQSAASGNYFDPYEQVGRAGLLCHCLLKDTGLPNRVRTMIASHQRIQESEHRKYTVRIPPGGLGDYIRGRKMALSSSEVEGLVAFFQGAAS